MRASLGKRPLLPELARNAHACVRLYEIVPCPARSLQL